MSEETKVTSTETPSPAAPRAERPARPFGKSALKAEEKSAKYALKKLKTWTIKTSSL